MTKKNSRIIGIVMLLAAVIFVIFALNNPQLSFPWGNTITYSIYIIYLVITIVLLIAPFGKKQ